MNADGSNQHPLTDHHRVGPGREGARLVARRLPDRLRQGQRRLGHERRRRQPAPGGGQRGVAGMVARRHQDHLLVERLRRTERPRHLRGQPDGSGVTRLPDGCPRHRQRPQLAAGDRPCRRPARPPRPRRSTRRRAPPSTSTSTSSSTSTTSTPTSTSSSTSTSVDQHVHDQHVLDQHARPRPTTTSSSTSTDDVLHGPGARGDRAAAARHHRGHRRQRLPHRHRGARRDRRPGRQRRHRRPRRRRPDLRG